MSAVSTRLSHSKSDGTIYKDSLYLRRNPHGRFELHRVGKGEEEMDLSIEVFPFLKDHRVQGMVVLPGAMYVDMALAVDAEGIDTASRVLTDLEFQQMLVFSEDEVHSVQMRVAPSVAGEASFAIESLEVGEARPEAAGALWTQHMAGKLSTVSWKGGPQEGQRFGSLAHTKGEALRSGGAQAITGPDFYQELWNNGNQYGPSFRAIEHVWRGEREALGALKVPDLPDLAASDITFHHVHPALFDACIQMVAAAQDGPGKPFVLTRIQQVRVYGCPIDRGWSYACLRSESTLPAEHVEGDVVLFDDAGQVVVELHGVCLQFLQQHAHDVVSDGSSGCLAISATFTAEPLEDALMLWMPYLDRRLPVRFAPYNQVFQQLLDPSSLLATNHKGLNVLLVRFEDWTRHRRRLVPLVDTAEKARLLTQWTDDMSGAVPSEAAPRTLPNAADIAQLNPYETDYLYQEIFVDQVYLKHGIVLRDGDCVVDVGANVGMFSLFVQQQCTNATIYAFEPAPPAFEALRTNTTLYCPQATVFNCGLADAEDEAQFTFYPRSSVFSSFNANSTHDEQSIKTVIRNVLQHNNTVDQNNAVDNDALDAYADDLMMHRLERETFTCQLRTLSSVIKECSIAQIDLLKIDAEKSELRVLRGIDDQDWVRIKQIVLEVHDQDGHTLQAVMNLLHEKGFECAVEEEMLLEHSGLYNLYALRPAQSTHSESGRSVVTDAHTVEQHVNDLGLALRSAAERTTTPYLVCICPGAPLAGVDAEGVAFYQRMEDRLALELADVPGVYLVRSSAYADLYPVETYYDPDGDTLGHVPFTPEFFAALGTTISRKLSALQRRPPYKVIILDCDQTLWRGVCGEDGPQGIQLDPAYVALQQFMVAQQDAGMLLCLCSKNNEEDVFAVFDSHPEMPLQRDHLVSWRINWRPKSENLHSLAEELQLGLDSFIFIDDSPMECAEVQARCPEVLTLQLPPEQDRIPRFLADIWAFDHVQVTEADKQRTLLYQQNAQRGRFRKASLNLVDFLADLELDIRIDELMPSQLTRASQLTQRTNQFNVTTIRRSEAEIQQFCQAEGAACLVVTVSDRFGDYGLVGEILFTADAEAMSVDTFLLSCRALGRGVEHRMLARLGEIAQERGVGSVRVRYIPTKKNQPIRDFLESVGAPYKAPLHEGSNSDGKDSLYTFPAAYAAALTYDPDIAATGDVADLSEPPSVASDRSTSAKLHEMAITLPSAELILQAIVSHKRQRPSVATAYVAPTNDLERQMSALWQHVLGIEEVGIHDNFFEVGGTSLKGVQLVIQLQRELHIPLTPVTLYEHPTISAILNMVEAQQHGKTQTSALEAGRSRGAKRRAARRSR